MTEINNSENESEVVSAEVDSATSNNKTALDINDLIEMKYEGNVQEFKEHITKNYSQEDLSEISKMGIKTQLSTLSRGFSLKEKPQAAVAVNNSQMPIKFGAAIQGTVKNKGDLPSKYFSYKGDNVFRGIDKAVNNYFRDKDIQNKFLKGYL